MSQSSSDPSWQNTKNSESYCEPFTARQYLPVREFYALISIFCSWQNLIDRPTKSVFQGKASRRRGRVRRSLRHRLVGLPGLAFGIAISFAEWPFSRQAEKILRDLDCEAFALPFSSGRNETFHLVFFSFRHLRSVQCNRGRTLGICQRWTAPLHVDWRFCYKCSNFRRTSWGVVFLF